MAGNHSSRPKNRESRFGPEAPLTVSAIESEKMNILNILALYRDYLRRSMQYATAAQMLHVAVLQTSFWTLLVVEAVTSVCLVTMIAVQPNAFVAPSTAIKVACWVIITSLFAGVYCFLGPMTKGFENARGVLHELRVHRKFFKETFGFKPQDRRLIPFRAIIIEAKLKNIATMSAVANPEMERMLKAELRRAWDTARLFIDVPPYGDLFRDYKFGQ